MNISLELPSYAQEHYLKAYLEVVKERGASADRVLNLLESGNHSPSECISYAIRYCALAAPTTLNAEQLERVKKIIKSGEHHETYLERATS